MKFLDRWVSRRIGKVPWIRDLLTRAGEAIREARTLQKESGVDVSMQMEVELQLSNFRRRANDLLELRSAELACIAPQAAKQYHERILPLSLTDAIQRASYGELELALEDRGWVREDNACGSRVLTARDQPTNQDLPSLRDQESAHQTYG